MAHLKKLWVLSLLMATVASFAACSEDPTSIPDGAQGDIGTSVDTRVAVDGFLGDDAGAMVDGQQARDGLSVEDGAAPLPDAAQGPVDSTVVRDTGTVHDIGTQDTQAPYAKEVVDIARAKQLIASGTVTLVDVREPSELASIGCIDGSINLPWNSGVFRAKVGSLLKNKGLLIYCRSGGRSSAASKFAVSEGFKPVYDLRGGFNGWITAKEPRRTTGCGGL